MLSRLYPLLRSITGEGNRQTLRILKEELLPGLEMKEVPTDTQVFDWQVPKEWRCTDAVLIGPDGHHYADLKAHKLHVLNYSVGIDDAFTKEELQPHLYSLPAMPDAIPYRTSYYQENWGFCLPHRIRLAMPEGRYHARIMAEHIQGSLTYGELFIPGETEQEVLFSTHICHPQLADDNLSGMVVQAQLAAELARRGKLKYSYRFVFVPGTIGAITFLAQSPLAIERNVFTLVLSLLGDNHPFTYKPTPAGNTLTDRIMRRVLKAGNQPWGEIDFYPYGYDERQYASPGINMPAGRLSRARHGEFPQYHTSQDNLEFISQTAMDQSLSVLRRAVDELEGQTYYRNLSPMGEPQLGKRGLYQAISGGQGAKLSEMGMLWLLNQSDGKHSIQDIAERSGLTLEELEQTASILMNNGLLSGLKANNPAIKPLI